MGETLKRQSPHHMPLPAEVDAALARATPKLRVPILVAGSRAPRDMPQLREPVYEVHGNYRFAGGTLQDAMPVLSRKRVVVFSHGYNVSRPEALKSGVEFFSRIEGALERDGQALDDIVFLLFTWPGDVGPAYFDEAQRFAQLSGVALYRLVADSQAASADSRWTLVTHSLGAHVGLRGASILGERRYNKGSKALLESVLLLAPAVENDVFERPDLVEQYHFPESAFGIRHLQIFASRADNVLGKAFAASEFDKALGFAGPEDMGPLQSLARRVREVLDDEFTFQLHDFSPSSATVMNPALHVSDHGAYWDNDAKADYYVNFMAR